MYRSILWAMILPLSGIAGLLTAIAVGLVEPDHLRFTWNNWMRPPDIAQLNNAPGMAGTPMIFRLQEPPARWYGIQERNDADRPFIGPAKALGFCYAPTLGRAARELAAFYGEHRRLAPSRALAFILDSAGASFWGTRQSLVVTTFPGPRAIEDFLGGLERPELGETCLGMAEVSLPDGPPGARVLVALSAKRGLVLERTPRTPSGTSPFVLRGRFVRDLKSPRFLVMGPDQTVMEGQLQTEDRSFIAEFDLSEGRWWVEIIADGPSGPAPLAQLSVYVGVDAPISFLGIWPINEKSLKDPKSYLAQLVNEDRETLGLAPLVRDEELDAIASDHSREMSALNYVGHRSPKTGNVGDRLRAAHYRSITHGENVALNGNLGDAQSALMQSLGHRRNLLSRQFSHLGVGAVETPIGWYVTQVFARPPPVIAVVQEACVTLFEQLNDNRRRHKLAALVRDSLLDDLARRSLDAPRDQVPALLARAREDGHGQGMVAVSQKLLTLENGLDTPVIMTADMTHIGLALRQRAEVDPPNITVIAILAKAP